MRIKVALLLVLLAVLVGPQRGMAGSFPLVGPQGPNPAICPPDVGPDICVNQFVTGYLNPLNSGQVQALTAPFVTAATTATTFLTYVLAPSAQTTAPTLGVGKDLRVTAWGVNGGSVSTNTFTLNFGTATATVVVTGTSAAWRVQCDIQNTGTVASPNQSIDCWGKQGTTLVAASQPASTQALTSAITLTLQSTNSAASQMTTNGAYVEIVQ